MKIEDSQLYALLARMLDGSGDVEVVPKNHQAERYSVSISISVHDNHRRDSPDIVLYLDIALSHPRLPVLKFKIPIPIEGEKAGIGAALEDLRKFTEREHFLQELPMLVIGGEGNPAYRHEKTRVPVKFDIIQIPYREVSD